MAVLSASFRLTRYVISPPMMCFDIRTGTYDRPNLREIVITSAAGSTNSLDLAIGRNGSLGTAHLNSITFLSEDGDALPAGALSIGLEWDSAPTQPTNFLRRVSARTTFRWAFPLGAIILAPLSSFGLWISAASFAKNPMPPFTFVNVTVEL